MSGEYLSLSDLRRALTPLVLPPLDGEIVRIHNTAIYPSLGGARATVTLLMSLDSDVAGSFSLATDAPQIVRLMQLACGPDRTARTFSPPLRVQLLRAKRGWRLEPLPN